MSRLTMSASLGTEYGPRALRSWKKPLMTGHPNYIDPLRWDPLLMKFTEYFSGAELARPSSLARGWDMPRLATAG